MVTVTGEEMVLGQLDRIIARTELRVEQHCIHASALAPYGNQAKRARGQLAQMLTGLAKLKAYRNDSLSRSQGPSPDRQFAGSPVRKRHQKPRGPIGICSA